MHMQTYTHICTYMLRAHAAMRATPWRTPGCQQMHMQYICMHTQYTCKHIHVTCTRSYEGNALEDPWVPPTEDMFTRSVSPEKVRACVCFVNGLCVCVCGSLLPSVFTCFMFPGI